RQLAVFVGGFSPGAAEAVCASDENVLEGLTSLLDKSLLRAEARDDGETRFSMLDTLREFATEQLTAATESDELQRRHAPGFLDLAESAEAHLASAQRDSWLG